MALFNAKQTNHLRVDVSDDVGDLVVETDVDVGGEGEGSSGSDDDVGDGDTLANKESSVEEDGVKVGELLKEDVNDSGVSLSLVPVSYDAQISQKG